MANKFDDKGMVFGQDSERGPMLKGNFKLSYALLKRLNDDARAGREVKVQLDIWPAKDKKTSTGKDMHGVDVSYPWSPGESSGGGVGGYAPSQGESHTPSERKQQGESYGSDGRRQPASSSFDLDDEVPF